MYIELLIEHLMENLSLGKVLESPIKVTGGLLHKMYAISTTSGKYAVKVLDEEIMKKPHALKNTINSEKIASALSKDIPAVSSIAVDGKQIHMQDGHYFMVFNWLEGRSVYAPGISVRHCRIIGDILGKIHKLNVCPDGVEMGTDDVTVYDWRYILDIASKKAGKTQKARKPDKGQEWYCLFSNSIDDIIRWNLEADNAQEYLKENRVISHRDLDPKNVMWDGSAAYLIDWEAAGYVNPYQELLEVINYWATDGNRRLKKEYFDAIIESYTSHINIDNVEWDKVFAGSFMGMLGWLEYNVRRTIGLSIGDINEANIEMSNGSVNEMSTELSDVNVNSVADGAEQVVNTINELYNYQAKLELVREWL